MRYKQLPADYAVVLQQINEDNGNELDDLVETMQYDKSRLQHIVSSLHHKGLITIEQIGYGSWLSLSTKGRRLMQYLWPESTMRLRY